LPAFAFLSFALQKSQMKPRHAAALALVGWYLLLPPINLDSKAVLDIDAPFSKWEIYKAFDSAPTVRRAKRF
jgi:hypothetical protein